MYYVEQVIDGVLCYRTQPHGKWHAVSREAMQKRMLAAEQKVLMVEAKLNEIGEKLKSLFTIALEEV